MNAIHRILSAAGLLTLGAAPLSFALPIEDLTDELSVQRAVVEQASGTIRSVGEGSFVLAVGDTEITIRIDAKTKYMLDGKESTKDKVLVQGKKVTVAHENKLATEVALRSDP